MKSDIENQKNILNQMYKIYRMTFSKSFKNTHTYLRINIFT